MRACAHHGRSQLGVRTYRTRVRITGMQAYSSARKGEEDEGDAEEWTLTVYVISDSTRGGRRAGTRLAINQTIVRYGDVLMGVFLS